MNEDELTAWLEQSTQASKVPLVVENPSVLAQVAQFVRAQQSEE